MRTYAHAAGWEQCLPSTPPQPLMFCRCDADDIYGGAVDPQTMVCIGGEVNGGSSCKGDSGAQSRTNALRLACPV